MSPLPCSSCDHSLGLCTSQSMLLQHHTGRASDPSPQEGAWLWWYDDTRSPGSSVGFVVSFLEPFHSPCTPGLARALSASGVHSPQCPCVSWDLSAIPQGQGRLKEPAPSLSQLFPFNCGSSYMGGEVLCPFKNMMIAIHTHPENAGECIQLCPKIMPVQRPKLKHTVPESRENINFTLGKDSSG